MTRDFSTDDLARLIPEVSSTTEDTSPTDGDHSELEIDRDRPLRGRYVPRSVIAVTIAIILFFLAAAGVAWYASTHRAIEAPDLVGKSQGAAERYVQDHDLVLDKVSKRVSDEPKGTVIAQNPTPGERMAPDTPIHLYVSAGSDVVLVPEVVGLSEPLARGMLEESDIAYEVNYMISAETSGTVLEVTPPEGSEIKEGALVVLTVALDAPTSETLFPFDLSGLTIALDPDATLINAPRDIPLEVAYKTQGLLEASGAKVVMTRTSLTKTADFTDDSRKKAISDSNPDIVITFTVATGGSPGLHAYYANGSLSSEKVKTSKALGDELVKELARFKYPASAQPSESDSLGLGESRVWLLYSLGNASVRGDSDRFGQEAFVNNTARSLYTAIGKELKRPLRPLN